MIWRLAWRNLWRHRTRTLIMVSAVAGTYGLMLVALGINDNAHQRMLEEATKAAGGDVLIHGDGYWATRASDAVIPDAARLEPLIEPLPEVRAVMPRIIVNGLVTTSAGARPVFLQAIDPERERAMRDLSEDLIAGTLLAGDERDPIILGSRIVDELELELGDRVVLTASRPDGEVTRALFHLSGIVETGLREADEIVGYTSIPAAREAVGMEGMLTQIGVLIDDTDRAEAVAAVLAERLAGTGDGLEVLSWKEAVPEMVGFVELDDELGYVYLTVIFSVVLFSITNTFLMAVMERVRELGLLSALGLRGVRIGRLLLTETVLMTAIAMAIGFLIGYSGHLAASHWGISLSAWGIEEIELSGIDFSDMVMYSTLNPVKWIVASFFVAAATIGSAVYPAWRAARLAPAEAMRFYE